MYFSDPNKAVGRCR